MKDMPNQEKFTNVLPVDWDGRFPFTNDSDEDFVFQWDKKQYLFPANKTVDMMKLGINATPLEVQNIRKKAARIFAEREFFKSEQAKNLQSGEKDANGHAMMMNFHNARTYSESDLKNFIQRCLTPLPEGTAKAAIVQGPNTEELIHRDDETGEPVTVPVKNATQSVNNKPGMILVN